LHLESVAFGSSSGCPKMDPGTRWVGYYPASLD
jgi:hypothetical protein